MKILGQPLLDYADHVGESKVLVKHVQPNMALYQART